MEYFLWKISVFPVFLFFFSCCKGVVSFIVCGGKVMMGKGKLFVFF
jgi:hypothetical protein